MPIEFSNMFISFVEELQCVEDLECVVFGHLFWKRAVGFAEDEAESPIFEVFDVYR